MVTRSIGEGDVLAHLARDGRGHFLIDHLKAVAELARERGRKFGTEEHARLAGLWHDLGKYSGDFQRLIRTENGLEAQIEGEGLERDHSTAGACLAMDRTLDALPIAIAIAGHHAGLANLGDLRQRLVARRHLLEATLRRRPPTDLLDADVPLRPSWITPSASRRFELWIRMLFSALCDADFLDTEAFFDPARAELRGGRPSLRDLRDKLFEHVERLQAASDDGPVNAVRREVQAACRGAATGPRGAYSLTVPTGGGKTLASLAFALEHAERHSLDRIIVVIPYTSIIEQNAARYRSAVGEHAVLEHHSALDPVRETAQNRVACENWDAPIVVTTTVQLFESLLARRPSRCRKLHNVARSVIVLDEAQALPGALLPTILDVLGDLVDHFGCSLVISTATQPAFLRSRRLPTGLPMVREICPPEMRLFERLDRVRVEWPSGPEPTTYDALASQIAAERACLAIVHLRADARRLCQLVDAVRGDTTTVHLSALMTPAHRSEVLAAIARDPAARVVSTQLVEAGVDLDFPVVFRALAGLDALAQAAGRCNREGRIERGVLRVFEAPTDPPDGVPRTGRDVARLMARTRDVTQLLGPALQREYFVELYERTDLRRGEELLRKREQLLFRDVAEAFQLIQDGWSAPLVIAHDDGAERVAALRCDGPSRGRLRALQRYTINVPRRALASWVAQGAVTVVAESVHVLEGPALDAYDARFGLVPERVGTLDPGVLVVG